MKVSQNTDSFFCICDKSGSTVHIFFIGDMLESGWQMNMDVCIRISIVSGVQRQLQYVLKVGPEHNRAD